MGWFLFYIAITLTPLDTGQIKVEYEAELLPTPYVTMNECFADRDDMVTEKGRPILNYQYVCIQGVQPDVAAIIKEQYELRANFPGLINPEALVDPKSLIDPKATYEKF